MDFKAMAIQAQQLKDNNGNAVDMTDLIAGSITTSSAAVVGAPNGATVAASSTVSNGLVKTVLTLTATPITIAGGASGVGEGGVKIFDMPEGQILLLGGGASLTVNEADANIDDDALVTLGVGTAVVAGGDDALGTDATDDDILNGADFQLAASTATGGLISNSSVAKFDGTGTAIDIYMNASVADADIDDDAAALTITGTITLYWMLLGDD